MGKAKGRPCFILVSFPWFPLETLQLPFVSPGLPGLPLFSFGFFTVSFGCLCSVWCSEVGGSSWDGLKGKQTIQCSTGAAFEKQTIQCTKHAKRAAFVVWDYGTSPLRLSVFL